MKMQSYTLNVSFCLFLFLCAFNFKLFAASDLPQWYSSLPLPYAADLTAEDILEDLERSLKSKLLELKKSSHIVARAESKALEENGKWRKIAGPFSASERFWGAKMVDRVAQKLNLKELRAVESILVFDSLDKITGQVHIKPNGEVMIHFNNVFLLQRIISKSKNQAGTRKMHQEILELHGSTGLIDIELSREWDQKGPIDFKNNIIVGVNGVGYLVDTEIKTFELSQIVNQYTRVPQFFKSQEEYFEDNFEKPADLPIYFAKKAKSFQIELEE